MTINRELDSMTETRAVTPPIAKIVDARGQRCPLPLLQAKQALAQVAPGDVVKVLATDSGSVRDFHAFARMSGHRVEQLNESGDYYTYLLQKSES